MADVLEHPTVSKEVQAATILQRSVCLTLECHYLGNKRKIDLEKVVEVSGGTMTMDERQFHLTKKLIDSKELNPVMRVYGVAKAKLRAKAIHCNKVFGERTYLIPLAVLKEVDDDLTTCARELGIQATALGRRYQAAVETQRVSLGPLFNAADYISPSAVVESFKLDWSYVSFAAPDRLEQVSHALALHAEQKHTDKLAAAFDEVLYGLRETAIEVLADLEEKLTPAETGKTKGLRGTALNTLQEFMKYLPARNMTGDDQLAAVMARVAARAEGISVETLKDDVGAREALRAAATDAKAVLAELVETKRRGISFGGLTAA